MEAHNNPFWEYSLTIYQRGAAQRICIELQEQWHANVSMVLLMCFMGDKKIAFDTSYAKTLDPILRWSEETIAVLRQARKFNKPGLHPMNEMEYYQHILNVELMGEQLLQKHLYDIYRQHVCFTQQDVTGWKLMVDNLKTYFMMLNLDLNKMIVLVNPLLQAVTDVEKGVLEKYIDTVFNGDV